MLSQKADILFLVPVLPNYSMQQSMPSPKITHLRLQKSSFQSLSTRYWSVQIAEINFFIYSVMFCNFFYSIKWLPFFLGLWRADWILCHWGLWILWRYITVQKQFSEHPPQKSKHSLRCRHRGPVQPQVYFWTWIDVLF